MLQLSLDWMDFEEAVSTVRELYDTIDIIEIGTPMIFEYGLKCVKKMKDIFPEKTVLADMKIMDAGAQETEMAVKMGADIVTVMGAANDYTIEMAAEVAHKNNRKLMVDLLGVQEIEQKTHFLEAIKTDYICVHTAFDMKERAERPVEELERVNQILCHGMTAIAGGITLKELDMVMKGNPDVVIVGGGILNADNRKQIADVFYQSCGKQT